MKVAIISARYMDQHAIEDYLAQVFGYGQASVTWKRGRFQCMLPRALTQNELEGMRASVGFTHYADS